MSSLEIPIWMLDRPWLRAECACGRSLVIPAHLLVLQWPEELLTEVVRRLRCRGCGAPATRVSLVDRADAGGAGGATRVRRIWLSLPTDRERGLPISKDALQDDA